MTNGDKFRQLDDEELARHLALYYSRIDTCPLGYSCPTHVACRSDECIEQFEDWLKQEVKSEKI